MLDGVTVFHARRDDTGAMSPLAAIATSGMQVAQRQLAAGAHNIANSATERFEPQVVTPRTLSGGGVTGSVSRAPADTGLRVEDLLQQRAAVHAFQANAAVLRIGGDLAGVLLDERA